MVKAVYATRREALAARMRIEQATESEYNIIGHGTLGELPKVRCYTVEPAESFEGE